MSSVVNRQYAAREMTDYITLPEQRVPVIAECDVLVVGGGAAGMSAAIAAARQGADVILVERYGYLGGLASGGLIVLLLTLDDGDGNQVVAGQCQELVERLEARDACFYPPKDEWGNYDDALVEKYRRWGLVWGSGPHRVRYSVAYDPEEFKFVANTWVAEAGVRLMYHRWATRRRLELDRPHGRPAGRITHVVFTSKAGRAGDPRARTSSMPPATATSSRWPASRTRRSRSIPWLWFRMAGVRDVDAAQSARGGFFFRTVKPGQVLMPWGAAERIDRRIDATDPDDLTFAEVECRRMVMDEVDRLRAQVPGFEDAYLTDVALTLGVTESRRLQGAVHARARRRRHACSTTRSRRPATGPSTAPLYHIPYRSLLPQRASNLLVAGRCISVDHRVAPRDEGDPARLRDRRSRRHRRRPRPARVERRCRMSTCRRCSRRCARPGAWLPSSSH